MQVRCPRHDSLPEAQPMDARDSPSMAASQRCDAFHVPVPGLLADLDLGYGAVAMMDEFAGLPAEVKVRILRDWWAAIKSQADLALVDLFRDFAASQGDRSIVQQIDHFKRSCKEKGIHCPSDFAVLLQQF